MNLATRASIDSTFFVNKSAKPITFTYSTNQPDDENWIAIFAVGGWDQDQEYLTWTYAPNSSGNATIDSGNVAPGNYEAYFLFNSSYTQLADKIDVFNPGDVGPVTFVTNELTLQNGRQGDKFRANIAGIIHRRVEVPSFSIVNQINASWVSVDAAGNLTGTPPSSTVGNTTVVVQARLKDGSSDNLIVTIPIVAKGESLVRRFRMLTMNLWEGGVHVNDYHTKQVQILASLNVDVVAFQETAQTAGQRLAAAMGWNVHFSGDTAVLSRYPLAGLDGTAWATEAQVSFDGENSKLIIWSTHLEYTPYGPYGFCESHMTQGQVFAREAESGRPSEITEISKLINAQLRSNGTDIPVLLAGDFNAPSHLDWTNSARGLHCGIGYTPWPTSIIPVKAGLVDSFRAAYPNPVAYPGNTWSPVHPGDPQDRIDFIYYGGGAQVTASGPFVIGKPNIMPNVANNDWPSDHRSFVSEFEFNASAAIAVSVFNSNGRRSSTISKGLVAVLVLLITACDSYIM